MAGFLGRLFKRAEPGDRQTVPQGSGDTLMRRATAKFLNRDDGPMAGATWDEGEQGQQEYDEFCERFEYEPGKNFMVFLRSENIPELERWLHPSNPSPEAKAFIRLLVKMMRDGETIEQQDGIVMFADDYLRREAANPQEIRDVRDALATLAQMLHKPIKLYFEREDGQFRVWDFES